MARLFNMKDGFCDTIFVKNGEELMRGVNYGR